MKDRSLTYRICPIGVLIAVSFGMMDLLTPVAAAQDVTNGLPGGATTLRETRGDWTVNCAIKSQDGHPAKLRALSQEQVDEKAHQRGTGNRTAAVADRY